MTEAAPATKGRVLIVDDDGGQRRLMQMQLEDEGFECKSLKSGEECLAEAVVFDPNVILLDINMPGIDGIETCRRLKQMPEMIAVPVVFITGHKDDDLTIVEALRAGGNDFISKDASQAVLCTRVRCQVTINRSQRLLRRMAITDELTGLFSRRFIFDALRRSVKSTQRTRPGGVACLFGDLDHFKKVNDTQGHLVGDETLRKAAAAMKKCTRETDVVGRLGGDEFVSILYDVDEKGATAVAEKIRTAVQQACTTTISIGIAIAETVPLDVLRKERALDEVVQRLLHQADVAMYASKGAGRNRVTVYTPELGK